MGVIKTFTQRHTKAKVTNPHTSLFSFFLLLKLLLKNPFWVHHGLAKFKLCVIFHSLHGEIAAYHHGHQSETRLPFPLVCFSHTVRLCCPPQCPSLSHAGPRPDPVSCEAARTRTAGAAVQPGNVEPMAGLAFHLKDFTDARKPLSRCGGAEGMKNSLSSPAVESSSGFTYFEPWRSLVFLTTPSLGRQPRRIPLLFLISAQTHTHTHARTVAH